MNTINIIKEIAKYNKVKDTDVYILSYEYYPSNSVATSYDDGYYEFDEHTIEYRLEGEGKKRIAEVREYHSIDEGGDKEEVWFKVEKDG